MKEYYDVNRIAYTLIPPHNPNCEKVFRDGGPVVVSPANGTEYLINRKDPEPLQLRCRAGNDVAKVYAGISTTGSTRLVRRRAGSILCPGRGR